MYYQVIGDSKNSYARLVFLNEIVSGQDVEYIDNLMIREKEQLLDFNENNCYICLLGLKKSIYAAHYGLTTNQYMQIYILFEQKISKYLEKHGYIGEIFLNLYGDKQIIVIFSPKNSDNLLPIQIVQYAQDCLQLIYHENFLDDEIYCNQTYFCEQVTNRKQISKELQKLIELSKMNFFYMEPVVITLEGIRKLQKKSNESDMRELRQEITSAINSGNNNLCKVLLDRLMLNTLKFSFDFYLLQDTVLFLKNFYLECCIAYGINLEESVDFLFDYKNYEKIETFTDKMLVIFENVIYFINLKEKKYGQLVQKALRIINTSFHKPDVSASYIANQVNISPSYLSSVFNREVGMSISQYLSELRINRAKKMLEKTNLYISDISLSVGYSNKRYFTQIFKQKVGCTPKEYRDSLFND